MPVLRYSSQSLMNTKFTTIIRMIMIDKMCLESAGVTSPKSNNGFHSFIRFYPTGQNHGYIIQTSSLCLIISFHSIKKYHQIHCLFTCLFLLVWSFLVSMMMMMIMTTNRSAFILEFLEILFSPEETMQQKKHWLISFPAFSDFFCANQTPRRRQ